MFDHHFPLMKYAFCSEEYYPVILENDDSITETGLKYVNNDMCYPCIINIGQIIRALQSGQYDLKKIDAYVEILSRCDQLRRDLYSLPTPRDVQEMEKEKRRRRAEEQGSGSGYVILAPVEELDADCPEVEQ